MVNRILVGAGYGLKDWIIQRMTAIVMAVYTLLIAGTILAVKPGNFAAWKSIFSCGIIKFATFLFFLSLAYHAWIGVRDLWMDYVNSAGLRLALHTLTILALAGYAGWVAEILWRL